MYKIAEQDRHQENPTGSGFEWFVDTKKNNNTFSFKKNITYFVYGFAIFDPTENH